MKPIEKKVWSELETFARAMQRGARVLLSDGNMVTPGTDPTGVHVSASVLRQYPIKEIIEPAVLRDWTAEDAKKHVGFAWRTGPGDSTPGLIPADGYNYCIRWGGREYATPIPGTDPAKWDWKPCKVEVPAEKPIIDWKIDAPRLAGLSVVNAMLDVAKAIKPNMMIDRGWVERSLADLKSILEQP